MKNAMRVHMIIVMRTRTSRTESVIIMRIALTVTLVMMTISVRLVKM